MSRLAILGSGPMAAAHLRALRAAGDEAVLVGVHDSDAGAAEALAETAGVEGFTDLLALLRLADAVVVATAPDRRAADAERALALGLDVLVEPLDTEGLRALQATAQRVPRQQVLAIAHDVVYDPTLRAMRRLIGDGQILSVDATWHEAFDNQPGHRDVTSDLLLSPLQAVLHIAGRPPSATQGAGRRVRRGQGLDLATATLCFDDDLVAVIAASRAGMRQVRELVVETPQARVVCDLLTGSVEAERDLPGRGVVTERLPAGGPDAHTAQLAAFLRSCRDRRPAEIGLGVALSLLDVMEGIRRRIDLVSNRPAATGNGRPLRVA